VKDTLKSRHKTLGQGWALYLKKKKKGGNCSSMIFRVLWKGNLSFFMP